jgi:hypothetical protein
MSRSWKCTFVVLALALLPMSYAAAPVTVTAADPPSAVQGTLSLDVTVSGSGFDNSAAVKFYVTGTTNTGGIVVKNVNVRSSKSLIATIDVTDTAIVNKFDIEVALTSGRKGKGTTLFSVQAKETGKPTEPDPCVSPNLVTEATFPSFVYTTVHSTSPWATAVFLGDASGRCTKKVGVVPGQETVGLKYDADSNLALIVFEDSIGVEVVTASIGFDANGPSISAVTAPVTLLDASPLVPPDLAGWIIEYGTSNVRISPDGAQVVMNILYLADADWSSWVESLWTCDLSYDAQSRIQPIHPSSCREVNRGVLDQAGSGVAWGAVPGTLYVRRPASFDSTQVSLYRLTLQPPPARALVEELFNDGGTLTTVRATATSAPEVSNGELVALYEDVRSPTYCSKVVVIDAYNCANLNCPIVNTKGMRTVTWLPDGRLAGKGQTPPDRRGRCQVGDGFVTYPAIDPYDTPATWLHPLTGQNNFEGSGGGW